MLAALCDPTKTGGRYGDVADAPGPPPDPEPGEPGINLLRNSRWAGQGAGTPTDWVNDAPSQGTIDLEEVGDDHRAATFIAINDAYTGKAQFRQSVPVVTGQRYCFSIYVEAVAPGQSTEHVILNWYPFDRMTLVAGTVRPTVGTVEAGQRVYCIVEANITGDVPFYAGLDRTGEITLSRPQLDPADHLRGYVATDPTPPAPEPSPDIDFWWVHQHGKYEGNAVPRGTANAAMRHSFANAPNGSNGLPQTMTGRRDCGFRLLARKTGRVKAIQFQIASNFNRGGSEGSGIEISKSAIGGNVRVWTQLTAPHLYPHRVRIFPVTSVSGETWNFNPSTPLYSHNYTVRNANGSDPHSRPIVTFEVNLDVTEGDRFVVYSDAINYLTHGSVNANGISSGAMRPNPLTSGPFFNGAFNVGMISGNALVPQNGMLEGIALIYEDGSTDGWAGMDRTFSSLGKAIGGSNRARQIWNLPYYRYASSVFLCAWKTGNGTAANIDVVLTGPFGSRIVVFSPSDFGNTSQTLQLVEKAIPGGPVLLEPGINNAVEIRSTGSGSDAWNISLSRDLLSVFPATSETQIPPPPAYTTRFWELHAWSGTAETSSNGGSSWVPGGYPGGGANLPVMLNTGQTHTVTDPRISEPQAPVPPTLKTPIRTLNVSNSSQLTSAISSAVPGDHIVLANGTYAGNFTLDKTGTESNPIVVRAANLNQAVLSGLTTMKGSHLWAWGLKFLGSAARIAFEGSYHKAVGCWFEGWGSGYSAYSAVNMFQRTDFLEICYCHFTKPGAFPATTPEGEYPLRIGIRGRHEVNRASYDTHIHHCHFIDFPAKPAGGGYHSGQADAIEMAPIGINADTRWLIEYNRFEDIKSGDGSIIDLKGGRKCRVLRNTAVDCAGRIDVRSVREATIRHNWLENTQGIAVFGRDHVIEGNRLTGGGAIRVLRGTVQGPDTLNGEQCQDVLLRCNIGALRVGQDWSGSTWEALRTRIEGHSGSITYGNHSGTTVNGGYSCPANQAAAIPANQVGPGAL